MVQMQLTLVLAVLLFATARVATSSEQVPFQTIVREIRPVDDLQSQLQQQDANRTKRFYEIKKHLLNVLRSPDWRDEFYRLIREVNAKMNLTENTTVSRPAPAPAPAPAPLSLSFSERRLDGLWKYRLFQLNGSSHYVYRSLDATKNGRARRITAKFSRKRTSKCSLFYKEAYCLYGECVISNNFNVLLCRCPRNASGNHCELKKLDQCVDQSGRHVVERRRNSSLYAHAKQPAKIVVQQATRNSRMSSRNHEEVPCDPIKCKNRGKCMEVPGVAWHCQCYHGYVDATCSSFSSYILISNLWEAQDRKLIGQNTTITLDKKGEKLVDGLSNAICSGRYDETCVPVSPIKYDDDADSY